MINIRVAQDFSRHPAGRFEKDGPYSGESFRRKHLAPPLKRGESVTVDMDGARGYGSSFLEEAFGGLIRDGFALPVVLEKLKIHASNPSLEVEILAYLNSAWETAQNLHSHDHARH